MMPTKRPAGTSSRTTAATGSRKGPLRDLKPRDEKAGGPKGGLNPSAPSPVPLPYPNKSGRS